MKINNLNNNSFNLNFKSNEDKKNNEQKIVIKPSLSTYISKGALMVSMYPNEVPETNSIFKYPFTFFLLGSLSFLFLRERTIDVTNDTDKKQALKDDIILNSIAPIGLPLACLGGFLNSNKQKLNKQGKIGAALGFGSVCLANIIDSVLQYKNAKKQLDKFDKNC